MGEPTDVHDTIAGGKTASLPHPSDHRAKESLVWSVVNLAILGEASTKQGLWRVENNKT